MVRSTAVTRLIRWAAIALLLGGLGVALGSIVGPLSARWYVAALVAVCVGALAVLHTLPLARLVRGGTAAGVVLTLIAAGLGPWVIQRSGSVDEADVMTPAPERALFLSGDPDDGIDGVVLPGSGRYVDWTDRTDGHVLEEATSSAGWVFQLVRVSGRPSVVARDLKGRKLWQRALGSPHRESADQENGVVAADGHRAVVLTCPGEDDSEPAGRCSLEAVDRSGRTLWRREVSPESSAMTDLWFSDAREQVPRQPWLITRSQKADSTRKTWFDLADGHAKISADDLDVMRLSPRDVLTRKETASGKGCRIRALRDDARDWSRTYQGAMCSASLDEDGIATKRVAYLTPNLVVDLRTGDPHRYAGPDDQPSHPDRGGDLVLDNGHRVWVTEPLTGRVLWRVHHAASADAGDLGTSVHWTDRSFNPFRPRSDGSDSREVRRVKIAPSGSSDPVTCDLPPGSEPSVIGTDRIVIWEDDRAQIWRCP